MNLLFGFMSLILTASVSAQNDSLSEIKRVDLKYYQALDSREVKDFYVEAEVEGLADKIDQEKSFGKVEKITFKIYWVPTKTVIEVDGLGSEDAFVEKKAQLVKLILGIANYMSKVPFELEVTGLSLKLQSKPNGDKLFLAEDAEKKSELQIIEYLFSKEDLLKNLLIKSTLGTREYSKNGFKRFPWSRNQYVLEDQTYVETQSGGVKIHFETEIEYTVINGRGYVSQIERNLFPLDVDGKKIDKMKDSLKVEFSNFKVNQNVAGPYLAEKERKYNARIQGQKSKKSTP